MAIGIRQFREPAEQRLDRMLTQPFRGDARDYPLGQQPAEEVALLAFRRS